MDEINGTKQADPRNSNSTNVADKPIPEWQKSIPTIHKLDHSQALRVLWALEEVHLVNGLKYSHKNYPRMVPKNEALLQISPMGKSPILTVDDLDGKPVPDIQLVDGVLMETHLILKYISDTYAGNLWIPETEAEKRRDVYFREFAHSSLLGRVEQPLVLEIIPEILPFPLKQILRFMLSPLVTQLLKFQTDHYNHMESFLTEKFPYFAGKKLGIADFCFEFPVSLALQRRMVDPGRYPKIKAWHERISSRPAYLTAIEKGGGWEKYDLEFFGMKGQKLKF